VYSLDCNHSHLILVDEDPQRPGATGEMRVRMLKHISLQRTGYGGELRLSLSLTIFYLLVLRDSNEIRCCNRHRQYRNPSFVSSGPWRAKDITGHS